MEAMLCKVGPKQSPNKSREIYDETKGSNKVQKTKHACIVETYESTRKRLGSVLPRDHEDNITEQGVQFDMSLRCGAQFNSDSKR